MEATANYGSITTEPWLQNGQRPKLPGGGGPNALTWHQILVRDSIDTKTLQLPNPMEAQTIAMHLHRERI